MVLGSINMDLVVAAPRLPLGIRREQTVACGNSYEDVEMLRWAGLGVASHEAVPQAKEAADLVARPIEEDGVAIVIEDLLGRGEIG